MELNWCWTGDVIQGRTRANVCWWWWVWGDKTATVYVVGNHESYSSSARNPWMRWMVVMVMVCSNRAHLGAAEWVSAKARRRRRLPSTQGRDKSVIISSGCVDIGIRLGAEVVVTNGWYGNVYVSSSDGALAITKIDVHGNSCSSMRYRWIFFPLIEWTRNIIAPCKKLWQSRLLFCECAVELGYVEGFSGIRVVA